MDPKFSKRRILVAGASGYVGGRLVPRLIEKGYPVRCLARTPEKLAARNWEGVEVVQGDVFDPASLAAALEGMDIAYYLIHSMSGKGDFEAMDMQAAGNFGTAAAEAGIKRIIYLGGLAKDSDELSAHLRSRQEVGRILAESDVAVTELRASIIIGSGSASFEIIRDLVHKLPVMITPRWVRSKCEPISIRNVIDYLIGCLEEPRTARQVLEIGGGEILTYADMMRQVAEVMGKSLRILSVPVLTPRLSAYWLNIVTSVPMSIAYPLIEGLRNDSVSGDRRIREWIPLDLLPFREAVRRALTVEKEGEIESRWTEASGDANREYEAVGDRKVLRDLREIVTDASPEAVFRIIQRIGGETGWYYADWTWKLRGVADRLIGGVGMRRGRRHPRDLRLGDAVDFWRVDKFIPSRLLRLKAEMKLPGLALLEFQVYRNEQDKTVYRQEAIFYPINLWGTLYWYGMLPAHFFIFRNIADRIVRHAEIAAANQ
ncbi:MAG: SDR family oxidoreductase [Calditrichia bacterium]